MYNSQDFINKHLHLDRFSITLNQARHLTDLELTPDGSNIQRNAWTKSRYFGWFVSLLRFYFTDYEKVKDKITGFLASQQTAYKIAYSMALTYPEYVSDETTLKLLSAKLFPDLSN